MKRRGRGFVLALTIGFFSCWMAACGSLGGKTKAQPSAEEEIGSEAPGTACRFRDFTAEPVQVGCEPGATEEETR
ncbi:hypothetical protein HMPREF9623_01665 [Stomatobaculum longum]|uniref:Lipoprotein n=1 Tax=Stomatobaculum longum TaxID=796942 RepID=A0AA37DFH9_9FIRM|nr:hypothetical protein [Stomatobaculum longum]EHO15754.1 hypothetical protein HMPREF9623_01665 [Stomatobaculum longum]